MFNHKVGSLFRRAFVKCGCKLEVFLKFKERKASAVWRSGFTVIDEFRANQGRVIAVDTAPLLVWFYFQSQQTGCHRQTFEKKERFWNTSLWVDSWIPGNWTNNATCRLNRITAPAAPWSSSSPSAWKVSSSSPNPLVPHSQISAPEQACVPEAAQKTAPSLRVLHAEQKTAKQEVCRISFSLCQLFWGNTKLFRKIKGI